MIEYLDPDSYTHLCPACRQTLTAVTEMYRLGDMPDSDDEEAPCDFMYDQSLFCGGQRCHAADDEPETAIFLLLTLDHLGGIVESICWVDEDLWTAVDSLHAEQRPFEVYFFNGAANDEQFLCSLKPLVLFPSPPMLRAAAMEAA